ncbi:MAG TPA: hypothetical protein VF458_24365 [Ktedonobacteraceae bacterium]
MSDPTQLLPQPVLAFLHVFVVVCRLMNHYLGYGWGTLAFIALMSFLAVWPGICYWSHLLKTGASSDEAAKQSSWVFMPLFVLFLLICGYVYFHGGNVTHPI